MFQTKKEKLLEAFEMANDSVTLGEAKDVVEVIDGGLYSLAEKIACLEGYVAGVKQRSSFEPAAEEYTIWVCACLQIICTGGTIANVPIQARGKFDVKPYRALDLIPASTILRKEE